MSLVWLAALRVIQLIIVEFQWDGRNTGLMPVTSHVSEKSNEEDRVRREAHFTLPNITDIAGQTLT